MVWLVIAASLLALAALAAMGWHMKTVAEPERARQLRATAKQRRLDKLAIDAVDDAAAGFDLWAHVAAARATGALARDTSATDAEILVGRARCSSTYVFRKQTN
ncbi:hypothetical protein AB1Y20_007012 [Prymnesium parvum]|uniref:Uncharacterized protein n=1 Tax=Prymnesium parvum TaxID=97485 RepID=A0AB34IZQ6_PRYPA